MIGDPLLRGQRQPRLPGVGAHRGTGDRRDRGAAAVAAVFALAVGAILRHGAGAVTIAITAIILPYLLTAPASPCCPHGAADWLLRVTPAAAFAIRQVIPAYPQVAASYTPYQRLLPARAVGRARGAVRLGGARPGPGRLPAAQEGRVSGTALHAEWTKLRTLASTSGCCSPPSR